MRKERGERRRERGGEEGEGGEGREEGEGGEGRRKGEGREEGEGGEGTGRRGRGNREEGRENREEREREEGRGEEEGREERDREKGGGGEGIEVRREDEKREALGWKEDYSNSLYFHLHLLQHSTSDPVQESVSSPVVQRYSAQMGWCTDYRTSPPQPNTLAHSRGQQETSPFFTSTQMRVILVNTCPH